MSHHGSLCGVHAAGLLWMALSGCASTHSNVPLDAPTTTITTSATLAPREGAPPGRAPDDLAPPLAPLPPVFGLGAARPTPQIASVLSDGQIALIATDFHRAEIDDATIALEQTEDPQVKAYAEAMVAADANVEQHLNAVIQNQNLAPSDSTLGTSLRLSNQALRDTLQAQSGEDFDHAYIGAELKGHEEALRLFDDTLIPDARSPMLKGVLESERPFIIDHIQSAKKLLASLPAE
jgi:putative membrane protein